MIYPTLALEKEFLDDYDYVIGIDEVGRGPLAGPVVSAAVIFSRHHLDKLSAYYGDFDSKMNRDVIYFDKPRNGFDIIRDSKSLSEKQRIKANKLIRESFSVGIGLCSNETIDRINILEATYLAAKKALQDLSRTYDKDKKSIVLFDGDNILPNFSGTQRAIPQGDRHIFSISAASIVAKVLRDAMMMDYHKKYPAYGFDKHKGYGTKMHMDALKKYGPSDIHRKSFRPISDGVYKI